MRLAGDDQSSKTTGENRCPLELTTTMRAPAVASAVQAPGEREVAEVVDDEVQFRPLSGALLAGCHDSGVVDERCNGSSHPSAKAATEPWSARSSLATAMSGLRVAAVMPAAARWPAARSRTASVTAAPLRAKLASGLGSNVRRAAGHDRAPAAEISALADVGGGLEAESGNDLGHAADIDRNASR
jgi:hypothetical protein